ncbi:sirohydrochlorin chelatase [Microlunatus soli]|uniref:Sirohydrochlorin ferrochelatase n=1 Tax=Microlunatus soli TaxID=630515 RepID=A0A1H1WCV3_9ACTN|nr:CbiX/SirB N-terminal domain-containing protein [Microlunatus soli]SDS95097.1 Sirohydrochlorin ferrochelatase [Microlunatus soli]
MPVVLLAHGSRHPHGVASIDTLAAAVAERTGLDVRTAYLDLNQPDLAAAAAGLAADGRRSAVIVPLLFTPAFHARTDAPATIAAAATSSGIELITADIIGTSDALLDLLQTAAAAAAVPDHGPVLLTSVGSSRPEANAAVADLAERLAAVRGAPVRAAFATCAPRAVDAVADDPDLAGVLALFVGRGLLLDSIAAAASDRGIPISAPLEDALVPLVVERYAAAVRTP